ncbi:hypothetical protein SHI21_12080 [Bacteriovorax sp. PP10]|uniref:Uncharacterized protein n=1 Tax=Bacteriovorax antarcticus TaxID=3088717 RepID=A0ABU5VV65_9BACT|nr:hypothetical protein [Bacteriovorax sp. PP10]MEA9356953.1 hypothetical protein [Bacteriovorax sp. PP10]
MLKHLYKTLLISVISGSLLSFSPAIALAGEAPTQTTTDNNGVITAKTSHKFDEVSDTDMIASVAMIAAGIITGRMIIYYRPLTMDVIVAAAAGAAYIAGELLTTIKFNGTIKAMTVEVEKKNNGEVNEEQVKRLKDLKASYEEAKKTIGIKKILQLGAATGFAVAGGMAAYMHMSEDATVAACKGAIEAADLKLSNCVAAGASGAAASEATSCGKCLTDLKAYNVEYLKYINQRAVPMFSFFADEKIASNETFLQAPICAVDPGVASKEVGLSIKETCTEGSVNIMIANQTNAKAPGDRLRGVNSDFFKKFMKQPVYAFDKNHKLEENKKTLLDKVLGFLLPKAEAGTLQLLGYGAATLAAITLVSGTTMTALDTQMFVPLNRAVAWGLLAGVSLMSAKSSDNVIKKLDANIAKIDAILADLNKLAKGVKAQNISQQGINLSTINPSAVAPISFSTDSTQRTDCMANNSSTNCEVLANKLTSMPGFANLPDSFKDIASQSVALGDSLNGANSISGSTLSNAEALGAKQNAVAKLLRNQLDAMNKRLGSKNSYEKKQEKFQKGLAAKIKKDLASKGMTATTFMASIGSTPIDSSLAKKDITPATGNKLSVKSSPINIQDGAGSDRDASSLKLDFKEQTPGDGLSMGEVASSGGAAKEYDIKSQEINGEFGPSLFELISGRYIKSGYPKLLEEEPSKN